MFFTLFPRLDMCALQIFIIIIIIIIIIKVFDNIMITAAHFKVEFTLKERYNIGIWQRTFISTSRFKKVVILFYLYWTAKETSYEYKISTWPFTYRMLWKPFKS